ncbi:MAG: hypothetical protein ACK5LO_13585, partial [Leucobacter sp.]
EAQRELQIGKDAWATAKRRLLESGFLREVRDRYPRGYVDETGTSRGMQRRFRLFLQDPEPDVSVPVGEAVLELDEPYEEYVSAVSGPVCGKSAHGSKTPDQPDCGKSAHGEFPTAENPHTAENPQSFKGREKVRLVGYTKSNQPTNLDTDRARELRRVNFGPATPPEQLEALVEESRINKLLEELAPGCGLTLDAIADEIAGRVDLALVDVVQATRDTLLRAKSPVQKPAGYIAAVIVRKPDAWPIGGSTSVPFDPASVSPSTTAPARKREPGCAQGEHDWGPGVWGEYARSHCVDCGIPRRGLDPVFAALQDEVDSASLTSGGDR